MEEEVMEEIEEGVELDFGFLKVNHKIDALNLSLVSFQGQGVINTSAILDRAKEFEAYLAGDDENLNEVASV